MPLSKLAFRSCDAVSPPDADLTGGLSGIAQSVNFSSVAGGQARGDSCTAIWTAPCHLNKALRTAFLQIDALHPAGTHNRGAKRHDWISLYIELDQPVY